MQYFSNPCFSQIQACDYYTEDTFNHFTIANNLSKSGGISLYAHNVRSIPKHDMEMRILLKNLNLKFDVISICESWLNESNKDLYGLDGYHVPIQSCRQNKRGGGVAIYLKDSLEFIVRPDLEIKHEFTESVFVEIDKSLYNTNKNILIGCIYRVPNSDIETFNKELDIVISHVSKEDKLIYLMGDFNIDLLKSNEHSKSSDFLDLLYSYNLVPLITKPTRVTDHSATLIDNIFTNVFKDTIKHHQGILYTDMSDHFPVFYINSTPDQNLNMEQYAWRRVITAQKTELFKEECNSINWDDVMSASDGQIAY